MDPSAPQLPRGHLPGLRAHLWRNDLFDGSLQVALKYVSFGELLLPVRSQPDLGQGPALVHQQVHVEHGARAEGSPCHRLRPQLRPEKGFNGTLRG